jgi:UDP-glucose 4-epimerase
MRVLVTGGAGYIGSVVAAELVAGAHDVVVYDNLVKGHREAVPAGADFIEGDLLDTPLLTTTLEHRRIEAVVHMAAHSLVGESVVDPSKYYRNNVQGGLSLLDAMRAAEVGSLVFSSTAAVYGEPDEVPIDEEFPTKPTNPYGQTKLAFEDALRWYADAYGLRSASLRYFNAAGATDAQGEDHEPETHLVPLVLQAAAGRRPEVTIFGDDYPTPDGTCIRDYIHVVDLARAHVLALGALATGKLTCSAFNLGCGGEGYSVLQVIEAARRITDRPIPVRIGPRRAGDPARLVASSDRIRRELGWEPRHQDLDGILASAWRWMERHDRARAA